MVHILDGTKCAREIEGELAKEIVQLSVVPNLVIIMVGDDPRSKVYVSRKLKCAERIGAKTELVSISSSTTQDELLEIVKSHSDRDDVHGIIIQTPLPKNIDAGKLFDAMDPRKDVDGLGSESIRMINGMARHESSVRSGHVPATARGVIALLEKNNIDISGKSVAVIGRSYVVGLPTALGFLAKDATVTICHSKTNNLSEVLKNSEIIICAIGSPKTIKAEHVCKEHIVIDVGITSIDGKISGDVDFEEVKNLVSAITPVPGGIGPMTVVSLFENLLDAYNSLYNGGEEAE